MQLSNRRKNKHQGGEGDHDCPHCGETVKPGARTCTHCGFEYRKVDEAVAAFTPPPAPPRPHV